MEKISLQIEKELYMKLEKMAEIEEISIDELVGELIKLGIESKEYRLTTRFASVEEASEEESEEMLKALGKLSPKDLEIVETETIEL